MTGTRAVTRNQSRKQDVVSTPTRRSPRTKTSSKTYIDEFVVEEEDFVAFPLSEDEEVVKQEYPLVYKSRHLIYCMVVILSQTIIQSSYFYSILEGNLPKVVIENSL
jgi:hypothetical protein